MGRAPNHPLRRKWSYEQLAANVGTPGAVRAIGTANGSNRIAADPCHRVVRKRLRNWLRGGRWHGVALLDMRVREARHSSLGLSRHYISPATRDAHDVRLLLMHFPFP
jgi:O-6-methylguanine DNA methyltransferase